MKHLTHSPAQTKKIGEVFAKNIKKNISPGNKALIIGLKGDLGGGKTTFLQGFAKGLKIKERVLSPTFILMRKFPIPLTKKKEKKGLDAIKFKYFYHIDCYRIAKPKEILELGFKNIILDPQNIAAIEWADQIKKILPQKTLMLELAFINKNTRKITIKPKNNPEQKLIKVSFKLNRGS